MSVQATRLIRKMRGGTQAHLMECEDGHFYVVKFHNNPQHRRILLNEWIASSFLRYLKISTPCVAEVQLSPEFLAQNTNIYIQLGSRRVAIEPGWHFGSRYPGDPAKVMVYDFIPDPLLEKVVNLNEFLGVLCFDKWIGNADARQAIFFRLQFQQCCTDQRPLHRGFIAQMMDHGYSFGGPHWCYLDSPLQGLYCRPKVYRGVRSLEDFEPWLERIVHFPEDLMHETKKQLPPEWLDGDGPVLDTVLKKLISRCRSVPHLIRNSRCGRVNPFPNWK